MEYKVIDKDANITINIKKSDFIINIIYVESKEEADNKIRELSKKDATHNCYAYTVLEGNNIYSKFSDDNEPQGTAGLVMLDVLKKNNLINVLALTTRYFGGIKLGVGGLSSAYRKGVIEVLNRTDIKTFKDAYLISFDLNFSEYNSVTKILNQKDIKNLNFNDKVTVEYIIIQEEIEQFIAKIEKITQQKFTYKIMNNLKIKI